MWPFSKFPDAAGSFTGPAPWGGTGVTLLTDLVSHWTLDEASGTRADSYGTNDLAPLAGATDPGSAAGKVGNAADFVAANSDRLLVASNATLQAAGTDLTIAAWVRPDVTGAFQNIFIKGNVFNEEYFLTIQPADVLVFGVGANATAGEVFGPVVAAGQWYFVVGWLDTGAGTVNLQVNDGTPDSAALTGAITANNDQVAVGGNPSGGSHLDGRIDELSFWKRVLTAAERTALYNGGAGLAYPWGN